MQLHIILSNLRIISYFGVFYTRMWRDGFVCPVNTFIAVLYRALECFSIIYCLPFAFWNKYHEAIVFKQIAVAV